MNRIKKKIFLLTTVFVLMSSAAFAHTLYMSVEDNEDGTVLVTGMFSTGATAAGLEFRLEDKNEKVLLKDKMDEFGEYTFTKPEESPYYIIVDGGPGHTVKEKGPSQIKK